MGNIAELTSSFCLFSLVSLLWKQVFRKTIEESMVITVIFIICTTFVVGLLGKVNYIFVIMGGLSIISLITFIFNVQVGRKEKIALPKRVSGFFSPSFIVICLVFLYGAVAFRRALFTYPDEYFQWGSALKYMFTTNQLPYGNKFTGEAVTFSTATMFQYFWTGLGLYVESNGFVGNFVLAFIPAMLPFSGCKWKQKEWCQIFLYAVILFFSLNLLTYIKYYNLLQDLVLPLWTGGIIAWLVWGRVQRINWGIFCGSLIIISGMKSLVGPLFAIMICCVVIVRQVVFYEIKLKKWKNFISIKVIALASLSAVSVLCINVIWSFVIKTNVLNRTSASGTQEKSLEVIINGMINRAFDITTGTIKTVPYFSYMVFFVICFIGVVWYWNKIRDLKIKKIFQIVMPLYLIGFFLYFLVMLYAYWSVFGVADSAIVAGLERYLSYYMLVGIIPLYIPLFDSIRLLKKSQNILVSILLLVTVLGTGNGYISKATALNRESDSDYNKRVKYAQYREQINVWTSAEDKILILGCLSSNDGKMITYELGDRFIWNQDCYKMYVRYANDSKIYVDVLRYPELMEMLDYDYLWIFDTNEAEENYFRLRFEYGMTNFQQGDFYYIDKKNGISLEYVGNIIEEVQEEN